MAAIIGYDIGLELLKELGVEVNDAVGFSLHCYAEEPVTIEVKLYPDEKALRKVAAMIKQYRLENNAEFKEKKTQYKHEQSQTNKR